MKKVRTYIAIVAIAVICALNYQLFVFPNRFAPSGLNGICTMIQYVFGIQLGYLSLLINLPLAALVFFFVSKPLALRSIVYTVSFSVALLLLDKVDLSRFAYATENGTSTILGPLVAGIIYGNCYNWLLKASAYSGGTDFVAALIHKNHPEKSVLGLIFAMNVVVAISSYFVYGYQMEPVILCILYCFASNTVSRRAISNGRSAVRFEIVTDRPEELGQAIITRLHHSATVIPAKGMYLGKPTNLLVCVINNSQVAAFSALLQEFPNTFAVADQVTQVMGNFKHLTVRGKPERNFLDGGDGKAV